MQQNRHMNSQFHWIFKLPLATQMYCTLLIVNHIVLYKALNNHDALLSSHHFFSVMYLCEIFRSKGLK